MKLSCPVICVLIAIFVACTAMVDAAPPIDRHGSKLLVKRDNIDDISDDQCPDDSIVHCELVNDEAKCICATSIRIIRNLR